MPYALESHRRIGARSLIGRIALLTSICAIAFGMTLSLPAVIGSDGLVLNSALAAGNNGNGGGNGQGKGSEGAPGQMKQQEEAAAAENEAIDNVEDYAEDGETTQEPTIIPIAEDEAEAEKKVVKEVAGLDEDSELSDEEELEAIRSGWGTWRTADGPETVLSQ